MMQFQNIFYRTSDGLLDIEFLFVNLESIGWRAYVLSDINYKMFSPTRSTEFTVIHMLVESDAEMKRKINNFIRMSRHTNDPDKSINYVCWSKEIHNLCDIREVAKTWSEITAYYIRYGGNFATIQPILKREGIISF